MNDQVWRFIALLGAVAVGIGLYLGYSTISVPALNIAENCGSAFTASSYATNGSGSEIVAECDSRRHDRRTEAWVFIIAGLVVGGYAYSQSTLTWKVWQPPAKASGGGGDDL